MLDKHKICKPKENALNDFEKMIIEFENKGLKIFQLDQILNFNDRIVNFSFFPEEHNVHHGIIVNPLITKKLQKNG